MSGKIFKNHLKLAISRTLTNISPLQGLFLKFSIPTTNILAALPLRFAAEQQNICSEVIAWMRQSCRAAKYEIKAYSDFIPDNDEKILIKLLVLAIICSYAFNRYMVKSLRGI